MSEDAFKAMHTLKTGEAPPLHGTNVSVGGTTAYLSLPTTKGPTPPPAVILIHEWWGLNDHIRHWADRLAADGYAALAIDMYGGASAKTSEEAMALMKGVDDARGAALLQAAHTFVTTDARVKATKTATIGWCFGGGWSLRAALTLPTLDAAVIYYGRLIDDPKKLAPIHAELLGVFGNQDKGIPPAAVDAFEAALKTAGKKARILRYDADHAFANPSGARYDHKHAAAAWREVRAFLKRTLQTSPTP